MLKDISELPSENFFKELTIDEMVETIKYEKTNVNSAIGTNGSPLDKNPNKCAIDIKAEVGDNPEALERIKKKILRALAEESEHLEEYNIRKLDLNRMKLNRAIDNFILFQETRVGKSSLKSFKAMCSWLSYFINLNNIYVDELTEEFFKDMNEKIKTMPKFTLKKFKNSKYEEVIESVEKDKKYNIEYEILSAQQINKMFSFYKNNLFKFFIYKSYTKNNVVQYITEKEIVKHFEEFTDFELKLLRSEVKDNFVADMIEIALYTGMRNDDIYNIGKENINLEEEYLVVPKSKTLAGERIIPIHPNIFRIVERYYHNDGYVFRSKKEDSVNGINKRINREIAKYIPNKSKRFHALRKNCIQRLYRLQQEGKIQENTIQVLAGHKIDNITFDVYNRNKVHIEVLRKAINQISYDCIE